MTEPASFETIDEWFRAPVALDEWFRARVALDEQRRIDAASHEPRWYAGALLSTGVPEPPMAASSATPRQSPVTMPSGPYVPAAEIRKLFSAPAFTAARIAAALNIRTAAPEPPATSVEPFVEWQLARVKYDDYRKASFDKPIGPPVVPSAPRQSPVTLPSGPYVPAAEPPMVRELLDRQRDGEAASQKTRQLALEQWAADLGAQIDAALKGAWAREALARERPVDAAEPSPLPRGIFGTLERRRNASVSGYAHFGIEEDV